MKWTKVKLGEVATTSSGGTPSRTKNEYWGGSIPWIKSGQLRDDIINNCDEFISESGLKNSSASIVKRGTLLIALYGATAGKLGFANIDTATNQAVCAISSDEKSLNKRYLFYYLLSIRSKILNDASGGAQPNISQAYVRNIEVPLPPLPIQVQIAKTLDKADVLRRKDQELLTKYDQLAQAIFYNMFGDPVRNEKGWGVQMLGNSCTNINVGFVGQCEDYYTDNTGVMLLRTGNISERGVSHDRMKYVTRDFHERNKKSQVTTGDILIARHGDNGKACIIGPEIKEANVLNSVILRPDKNKLISRVLVDIMNNPNYREYMKSFTGGATQKVINTKALSALDIIIPPKDLQYKYEKVISILNTSSESVQKNLHKSHQLFEKFSKEQFS